MLRITRPRAMFQPDQYGALCNPLVTGGVWPVNAKPCSPPHASSVKPPFGRLFVTPAALRNTVPLRTICQPGQYDTVLGSTAGGVVPLTPNGWRPPHASTT